MNDLFGLLVLTCLILLIIGFINPKTSLFWYKKKRTKKISSIVYSIGLIVFFIGFGLTSNKTKEESTIQTSSAVNDKEKDEVKKETEKIKEKKESEKPNWSNNIRKKDIIGSWYQIKYFFEPDEMNSGVTELKDGDVEQKMMTITASKYATSFPYGSGDNQSWDYLLNENYLSVYTPNTKQEIYGYEVKINDEKNMLFLKENSGLVQIYKRENN